jgi:hypothetical protein
MPCPMASWGVAWNERAYPCLRLMSQIHRVEEKPECFTSRIASPQFLTVKKKQGRKSHVRPLINVKFCRTICNPSRCSGDTRILSCNLHSQDSALVSASLPDLSPTEGHSAQRQQRRGSWFGNRKRCRVEPTADLCGKIHLTEGDAAA